MDTAKILLLMCAFVLIVCLTLSISTLVVLRNAIAEHDDVKNDAQALVEKLDVCINDMNNVVKDSSLPTIANPDETQSSPVAFYLRERNGLVAIYSADGYMLYISNLQTDHLPSADREKLKEGIPVANGRELSSLMEDYGS